MSDIQFNRETGDYYPAPQSQSIDCWIPNTSLRRRMEQIGPPQIVWNPRIKDYEVVPGSIYYSTPVRIPPQVMHGCRHAYLYNLVMSDPRIVNREPSSVDDNSDEDRPVAELDG